MSQRYIGGVVTETTNVAQSPWTGEWTQQAALQGFAGAQAPLKVANSLRFRSSASAYLNRTPSVAGNRQTFTWSAWVKLGNLTTFQSLFCARDTSDSTNSYPYCAIFYQNTSEISCVLGYGGVNVLNLVTTQVLRDPSAWYHIVFTFNTTEPTASNRARLYINGVQITNFSSATYPTQNFNSGPVNSTVVTTIGNNISLPAGTYNLYFDGYLANVNFIDGQALPPTAFGTINKENGVWTPTAYTGSYGTNGFRLNFSNGTSTTTLGYDSSGNGNNWTTNNISLTAGSTYDWMIDSPTKYPGSSYGVGNYCVLSPIMPGVATGGGAAYGVKDGNLLGGNTGSGGWAIVGSTMMIPSGAGKFYFECTVGASGQSMSVGVQKNGAAFTCQYVVGNTGDANGYSYCNDGTKFNNGSSAYGSAASAGDVIGIAVDASSATASITFYKNNVSLGVAFTGITGDLMPAMSSVSGSGMCPTNFGQRPFAYTPPSGYKSLCTQNLPGVTIQNGAQYMAASLYTGSGAAMNISDAVNGVSFQPDFVWLKCRSSARINGLWDSVRGATKYLSSNNTDAEATDATNGVIAFLSSGYTVGATGTWNFSGDTFVGWQWKAGGTAVTNTAGSITSSVSANTTSGFAVVTYTGTGSSGTIGHGLGVAPSMVIIKARSLAGENWIVGHTSLPSAFSSQLNLNSTAAYAASTNFNSTNPTASVFSIGSGTAVNSNTNTYVAYCFAAIPGYSAFGSYTGNGSSDGPFVYCGFRPAFVLIKISSASGGNWVIYDNKRGTYNLNGYKLGANLAAEENNPSDLGDTSIGIDFLSNGFKIRTTGPNHNNSGGTYIYAAFAENPFQNALAR